MRVLAGTVFLPIGILFLWGCGRIWGNLNYTAAAPCVSNYPAQVLADNPVGYWRLNETSGTTAYDLGSGGVNIPYGGTTILGQPPAFPGFGNYSAVGTDIADINGYTLSPQATKTFTVEFWTKASATGGDINAVNGFVCNKGFNFEVNANFACGVGQFSFTKLGVTGWLCIAGYPNDTSWHHVAWVSDTTGQTAYLDGNPAGNNPDTSTFIAPTGGCYFSLGADAQNTNTQEFALYNTALSPARVQAHYNARSSCN